MKGDCIKMPLSASTLRQKNASMGPWYQQEDEVLFHRQGSLDSDCRTESSFSPSPPTDRMSVSELFNNLNLPRSSYIGSSNGQGLDYYNVSVQSPPPTYSSQTSQANNRFQFTMPQQESAYDSSFFVDSPPTMRNSSFSASAPGTPCTPGTPPLGGFDPFSRSMANQHARAIRGSPPYSVDCGSPVIDPAPLLSSRSISPADSDASSSNLDSMADLMASLSLCAGANNFVNNARTNGGNGNNWPNGLSEQELSNLYALNALTSTSNIMDSNRTLQLLLSSLVQRNLATNITAASLLGSNPLNNFNFERPVPPPSSFRSPPAPHPHPHPHVHDPGYLSWSGKLPERSREIREYSTKIFLGGIPWEAPEQYLISAFQQFGRVQVEWPMSDKKGRGFCYIIFENEKQVKELLDFTHNPKNDTYFFELPGRRFKSNKPAQIIPWPICDSNFVRKRTDKLDPYKTVFVGGLHGVINAECLCNIMQDTFDGVLYAGIDTDKYKYPQGSARIVFEDPISYMRAVSACYINIEVQISPVDEKVKITQRLQLKPYLEDSPCSKCHVQRGPYFCKDQVCFRYFCHSCWQARHSSSQLAHHQPLSRSSKSSRPGGSGAFNNNLTLQ